MLTLEEEIIDLIGKSEAMTIDQLVDYFFDNGKIPEREVKETVQRLRYEGKIKPNSKWEMELE